MSHMYKIFIEALIKHFNIRKILMRMTFSIPGVISIYYDFGFIMKVWIECIRFQNRLYENRSGFSWYFWNIFRAALDLNLRHSQLDKKTGHDTLTRKQREKDRDLRRLKKLEQQLKVANDSLAHQQQIYDKIKEQVSWLFQIKMELKTKSLFPKSGLLCVLFNWYMTIIDT